MKTPVRLHQNLRVLTVRPCLHHGAVSDARFFLQLSPGRGVETLVFVDKTAFVSGAGGIR